MNEIEQKLDEIDAALFSGDTFDNDDKLLENFELLLDRWSRRINEIKIQNTLNSESNNG